MDISWTLQTGSGSWNPVLWLLAFVVALGAAWLIRSLGRSDNRKGDALKPFISGNEEPADGGGHIPASNLYWGFTEAMKAYYEKLVPLHTGIPSDYVAWLLGVMALMLVIALTV
jgi:hypothetical protein